MGSVLSHHFRGTISRSCKRVGSPKTLGFLLKAKSSVWEKPRNEILFLFSCHSGFLRSYNLNPYVPVSGFCRVSSRISLNFFTTDVTFEELWYISSTSSVHFIQVTFLHIPGVIDVYILEKCLALAESFQFISFKEKIEGGAGGDFLQNRTVNRKTLTHLQNLSLEKSRLSLWFTCTWNTAYLSLRYVGLLLLSFQKH